MPLPFFKKKPKRTFEDITSLTDDPNVALNVLQADKSRQAEEQERIKSDIFKMIDQGVGSITDLWAPPRMKIKFDHIELGDECLAIFTISNWPSALSYGWLVGIIDDPTLSDIKMDFSLNIYPVSKSYAQHYLDDKYAMAKANADWEISKGKIKEANQKLYRKQQDTALMLRQLLEGPNENMFQVGLTIGIYGEKQWDTNSDGEEIISRTAYEDLIDKTNRFKKALTKNSQGGFGMKSLLHQQRDGIKSLLPLGYGGLRNYQNFYTSALATSFPFTKGNLQTDDGILHGVSLASRAPVFFNCFNRKWVEKYHCIISGSTGSGKAINSKIRIYSVKLDKDNKTIDKIVPKPIKDVQVGETILGGDGKPTKVLWKSVPRGPYNGAYRVIRRDGQELIADGDHQWLVYEKQHDYVKKIMTTKEIYDAGLKINSGEYKFKLPVMPCINNISEKELPVDPWLLGFLINNNYLNDPVAYLSVFKNNDEFERVDKYVNNHDYLIQYLKDIKLYNKTEQNKFIPEIYKQGSVKQRLALIQGLFNDSAIISDKYIIYNVYSEQLMKDIKYIIHTLGYPISVSIDDSSKEYDRVYILKILINQNNDKILSLQCNNNLSLDITNIEPIDASSEEFLCIAVDNEDKTYVAGDGFIVTHNSATAKTLLGRYAIHGTQIFIIDPAITAQGEYTNLATSLDGALVDFGGVDGIYINPFELLTPRSWKPTDETDQETAVSIYKEKKSYLVGLIGIMRELYEKENGAKPFMENFGLTIQTLIDRVYQFRGIHTQTGKWNFKQWSKKRMPSMNDFYLLLSEYERIIMNYRDRGAISAWGQNATDNVGNLIRKNSASERIMYGYYLYVMSGKTKVWGDEELEAIHYAKNIVNEYISEDKATGQKTYSEKASLFLGNKEADLTNQCIVFRFGKIAPSVVPIASYMTFELINSRVASGDASEYINKIVVLDEAWKMITQKEARFYLEKFFREGRKTNTSIWLISQSLSDFRGDNEIFFKMSSTRILLALPQDEVDMLSDMIELSPTMGEIINLDRGHTNPGQGLLQVTGKRNEIVAFYCKMTPLEKAVADTVDSTKPPLTPEEMIGTKRAKELKVGQYAEPNNNR